MQYLQENLFTKCFKTFFNKDHFFSLFTFFKQNKDIQVNKNDILKIFTTSGNISSEKCEICFVRNFINFIN